MSWIFRKSKRIIPGVRLNISKKGLGISAGVNGARVSINSKGQKTTSVGIPGSGLSYRKRISSKSKSRTSKKNNNVSVGSKTRSTLNNLGCLSFMFMFFAVSLIISGIMDFDFRTIIAGIVLFAVIFSFKFVSQKNIPQDSISITESRFNRPPLNLSEWQQTKDDLEEFVELFQNVKNGKASKAKKIDFPTSKGEIVFTRVSGFLTNFDATELLDAGNLYLTSKRINFLGTSITQEWLLSNSLAPIAQDEIRTVAIQSTRNKKVYGFKLSDDLDWTKFSYLIILVYASRDNLEVVISQLQESLKGHIAEKPRK